MNSERLNIPLHENPTLQKTWRVVWFLTPILFTSFFGFLLYRAYIVRDTLSAIAPDNTSATIRILKTPRSVREISAHLGDESIMQDSPWTVGDLFSQTKREMAIYMDGSEVIGVGIDRLAGEKITEDAAAAGIEVHSFGKKTLLLKDTNIPVKKKSHFSLGMLFPWYQGEVLIQNGGKITSAPFRFGKRAVTVQHLGRGSSLQTVNVPEGTVSYTLLHIEPNTLAANANIDVPLVFPGIRAVLTEAKKKGLTIFFGRDEKGIVWSLSIPEGKLTTGDIENFAQEAFYTPHINASVFEDGAFRFDELKTSETIVPTTTKEGDITITFAKDSAGNVIRATQTAHSLIVSNRDVVISSTSNIPLSSCHKKAQEFMRPGDLLSLLPASELISERSFFSFMTKANEIAFTKHAMKVCW